MDYTNKNFDCDKNIVCSKENCVSSDSKEPQITQDKCHIERCHSLCTPDDVTCSAIFPEFTKPVPTEWVDQDCNTFTTFDCKSKELEFCDL